MCSPLQADLRLPANLVPEGPQRGPHQRVRMCTRGCVCLCLSFMHMYDRVRVSNDAESWS